MELEILKGEHIPLEETKSDHEIQWRRTPQQNGSAFINILIISITLIVVAVPEGPSVPYVHPGIFTDDA